MKISTNQKRMVFAFAMAGFGLFALHSGSANAATGADLYKCSGNRSSVIDCCNRFVQKGELPKWWRETRSSCNKVVLCTDKNGQKCYIKKPKDQPKPPPCNGSGPNPNCRTKEGGGDGKSGGGGQGGGNGP
jgi:hypothetical protein